MAKEPEVPTSCHFTSPEKATPRHGQEAHGGVSRVDWLEACPVSTRPLSRSRRGSVAGDVRRQTSIGLQAVGDGRSRHLPYDYVLGVHRARPDPTLPDECDETFASGS